MLLDVKDLRVGYNGAEVLKGIAFSVYKGEVVTLIGANGAGKTTALLTISGLIRPAGGEIHFSGTRIDQLKAQDIVRLGLGHVPQSRDLFPYMSIFENLRVGAYLAKDRPQIKRDFRRVFDLFPILEKRKNQKAHTLSGGEQQMLAIARALMNHPKLLMLDEPSLALAPLIVKQIGEIVLDLCKQGTSILLVEQNAKLALELAHRGYVISMGEIVLKGDTKFLTHEDSIRKIYLGKV
jgi:branched-chain amino acid transport system ATP-binding protein